MVDRTRRDVIVSFGGDSTDLRAEIGRIDAAVGGLRDRFGGIGGLLAGVGLAGVGAEFSQFVDDLDALGKNAATLRSTADEFYRLRFAIGQTAAVGDDEFVLVMQRLLRHISRASQGVKESRAIFDDLGISWQELTDIPLTEAFFRVNEAFRQLPDLYARANVAYRLFEDPWRRLLPALTAAPETLRDSMNSVQGPTEEATAAAAALNDAIGLMNANLDELAFTYGPPLLTLLNDLIPLLTAVGREFGSWADAVGDAMDTVSDELRSQGVLGEIARRLFDPLSYVRDARDALRTLRGEQGAPPAAAPREQADEALLLSGLPDIPEPAEREQRKKRVQEVKQDKAAAVEDTREQVRQEAALWDFYHAELSALQADNAKAAEEAQQAQVDALSRLISAGASQTRADFYRALVEGETTLPEPKMRVVLDEASLFELPDILEQSLASGDYDVTIAAKIVPELLVSDELTREVDRVGSTP